MLNRLHAFTLIELALVLVIVSMMTGFGLQAFESTSGVNCVSNTEAQLKTIDRSLQNYAAAHSRYPKPAVVGLGSNDPRFGYEAIGGVTDATSAAYATDVPTGVTNASGTLIGSLPHVTLGLPASYASDCWGSKFTYAVANSQTSSDPDVGFRSAALGNIELRTGNLSSNQQLSAALSYVVVSHGQDKYGATPMSANNPAPRNCNGSTAGKVDRHNCDSDPVFFSAMVNTGDGNNYFDDLMVYSSKIQSTEDCPDQNVNWAPSCSGMSGVVLHDVTATVTSTAPNYWVGTTQVRCNDGVLTQTGAQSCVQQQPCAAATITWNNSGYAASPCSAAVGTLNHGQSHSNVPNANGGYTGSATVTCNNGTLNYSGVSCTPNPCSGSQSWGPGNGCTGSVSNLASGSTQAVANTNTAQFSGSADFSCNAGTLSITGTPTCTSVTNPCSAGTVTWGGGCSAAAGAMAHAAPAQGVTNSAGGYTGSANVTCNNGTRSASGTCFANCSARAEHWGSCNGNTPVISHGNASSVSNTTSGFTGAITMSCTNGSLSQSGPVCSPVSSGSCSPAQVALFSSICPEGNSSGVTDGSSQMVQGCHECGGGKVTAICGSYSWHSEYGNWDETYDEERGMVYDGASASFNGTQYTRKTCQGAMAGHCGGAGTTETGTPLNASSYCPASGGCSPVSCPSTVTCSFHHEVDQSTPPDPWDGTPGRPEYAYHYACSNGTAPVIIGDTSGQHNGNSFSYCGTFDASWCLAQKWSGGMHGQCVSANGSFIAITGGSTGQTLLNLPGNRADGLYVDVTLNLPAMSKVRADDMASLVGPFNSAGGQWSEGAGLAGRPPGYMGGRCAPSYSMCSSPTTNTYTHTQRTAVITPGTGRYIHHYGSYPGPEFQYSGVLFNETNWANHPTGMSGAEVYTCGGAPACTPAANGQPPANPCGCQNPDTDGNGLCGTQAVNACDAQGLNEGEGNYDAGSCTLTSCCSGAIVTTHPSPCPMASYMGGSANCMGAPSCTPAANGQPPANPCGCQNPDTDGNGLCGTQAPSCTPAANGQPPANPCGCQNPDTDGNGLCGFQCRADGQSSSGNASLCCSGDSDGNGTCGTQFSPPPGCGGTDMQWTGDCDNPNLVTCGATERPSSAGGAHYCASFGGQVQFDTINCVYDAACNPTPPGEPPGGNVGGCTGNMHCQGGVFGNHSYCGGCDFSQCASGTGHAEWYQETNGCGDMSCSHGDTMIMFDCYEQMNCICD